jgi:hypothetical protein
MAPACGFGVGACGEWLSGVFVRVGVRACVYIGGVGGLRVPARVACVCTCARACARSIGEDRQTSAALRRTQSVEPRQDSPVSERRSRAQMRSLARTLTL